MVAGATKMFLLGSIVTLSWVFCNFCYQDLLPRNWSVTMMISGLFLMGWGLIKGKQFQQRSVRSPATFS